MPKYQIYDNDEVVGFIVINKKEPSFQHVSPAASALDSPGISKAILWCTVLGGTVVAFVGVAGMPGWVGAVSGLVAATGLTGIVAWRSTEPVADEPESSGPIKVEIYDDKGRLRGFDDLKDKSISSDDLRRLAARMLANGFKWSKKETRRAGVSGPKHEKIKDEFLRLGYLEALPNGANGFKLTRTGRGVLRSV